MSIANNILEKIGNTPLVRINHLNQGGAEVVVKVESFNPGGSVKDRIAFAMIEAAEKAGVNFSNVLQDALKQQLHLG